MDAYKRVLEEEGVIYKEVNIFNLITLNPEEVLKSKKVIILPDGINQYLPKEAKDWIERYLEKGGNVFLGFNVGIKNIKNAYLEEGLFSEILGINYITYKKYKDACFTIGHLYIDNKINQDFLEIPYWKLINGHLLGGYSYGELDYPISRVDLKESYNNKDVYAFVISKDSKKYPGIIVKNYGQGKLIYANLPLGYLKAYADDFPLRTLLRVFLFKIVKIPHLINSPYGKGGIVINWHVDANIDWKSIPYMLQNRYLRKDIEYSIHITAGDFRDKPGDNLGFDACGKGREYVQKLIPFGIFGSHGGWAHNFFSNNITKGVFGEREIYEYISKNNKCLESITGYKIIEYSAPNGVHPQPVTTKVLEKLGMYCYYYTGDNGSNPNRTFINGKMISDKVIAFPISSFGKYASFLEIKRGGIKEEEVKKWLISLADYVVRNRNIRLIYSHPYDIPLYPHALKDFLDYVENLQNMGIIHIKPMSYYAQFILRFLNTKYDINFSDGKITLSNNEKLSGIALALPQNYIIKDIPSGIILNDDKDYQYLIITDKYKDKKLSISFYLK
jgi:hypothetical protein